MRLIFLSGFILIFSIQLIAQGEIDAESKIFFRNEKSYGVNLNTNGWGFDYRHAKYSRQRIAQKSLYNFDFSIIKHPKETKISNPIYITSRRFVFGKLNSTFALKATVGKQYELYRKMDKGGVSIRWYYLGGASLAFLITSSDHLRCSSVILIRASEANPFDIASSSPPTAT